ncbi:hypothetical protein BGY98DRAFT_1029469 [Russula aff. rugulosa BPL654]|nr:hypothetical protein BGY98DRAFT_1029469 [Russula aff. rugulosa BPL654]
MGIPLPIIYMSPHPYNHYNPNAQPNSPMSGPHSQGSNGSNLPPGYLSSPAHGLQQPLAYGSQPSAAPPPNTGPSRSGPSFPGDGTGRYNSPPGYPGSQSGRPPHGDGTGRYNSPPGYPSSQSGHPPPGDDTGRYYSPRYTPQNTPQNTVSLQAVIPRRQDLPPSTAYNHYTTPHVPSLPAHGTSQSGPLPHNPPHPSTNPGPSKQSGPPLADPPPPRGKRLHSALVSMMRYSMRQPVHVRINAETWVVGIIVGVVNLAGWVAGSKYRVEFESTDGSRKIGEFGPEDIAP